jgi:phosphoglycolate phosphatase
MVNKKLILFDLDGVLIDSKANMKTAWGEVCQKHNINVSFENYFLHIGRPFSNILNIIGISENHISIEETFKIASLESINEITFFNNVKDVLQELVCNNFKIGVVTSKDLMRTEIILSQLSTPFSIVRTPNNFYRGKPAPDHLLQAISISNLDPDQTLYIGDMLVDYQASKRAKIDYIHANWGYEDNLEEGVLTLDDILELKSLLLS